mmetsp:Transcript_18452/g.58088  ORF Transcript_18452/g.58088 Transcript_18452/m.58088 type:complete len:293 (+) Transcript_18452:453-1331(+)
MKGSTSVAETTSLHMLSTTTQHFRLVWTSRSRRPRPRTGTMMARVGLSTWETKVVPMRASRACVFSLGFALAEMRVGTSGWTSGLWMTVQHSLSDDLAAALTSGLVSHMFSVTLGTMSGRSWPIWLGAVWANVPSSLSVPTLIFQEMVAMPSKRCGRSVAAACGLTLWKKAIRHASTAVVTFLTLSSNFSISAGSMTRMYGSEWKPKAVCTACTTRTAPSRAGTDLRSFSDSWTFSINFIDTTLVGPASLIASPSSVAAAARADGSSSVVALVYKASRFSNAAMSPCGRTAR